MSRRVCFVTCLASPNISDSDLHVKRALEVRKVTVTGIPWNAPEQRFDGFDAVIFPRAGTITMRRRFFLPGSPVGKRRACPSGTRPISSAGI